jgi:hypothetical protein
LFVTLDVYAAVISEAAGEREVEGVGVGAAAL